MKNSINAALTGGLESESITPAAVLFAPEATGCAGSSTYLRFARNKGYRYIEVLNWCSSAGDWEFLVSKGGKTWRVMFQTNNYPRPGFSHFISEEKFVGTKEEALEYFSQG